MYKLYTILYVKEVLSISEYTLKIEQDFLDMQYELTGRFTIFIFGNIKYELSHHDKARYIYYTGYMTTLKVTFYHDSLSLRYILVGFSESRKKKVE